MFKILFEKNYNTNDVAILHRNASYKHAKQYSSKLQLVKGLCQKYTTTKLSFNFCLINSRWCSKHNWFMLTKICFKVISYTVMLICMSFISLGLSQND